MHTVSLPEELVPTGSTSAAARIENEDARLRVKWPLTESTRAAPPRRLVPELITSKPVGMQWPVDKAAGVAAMEVDAGRILVRIRIPIPTEFVILGVVLAIGFGT